LLSRVAQRRGKPPPTTHLPPSPRSPLPPNPLRSRTPKRTDDTGGADAGRVLKQIVDTQSFKPNAAYLPDVATTVDGFGGQGAALANAHSAGVYVQKGQVHAAGDLLPGPTGRVSSASPTSPNGGAAAQSGLGEMPIVSAGDITAASVYGAGGAAVAVAAPNAYYVGGGTRATSTADATNLYGGSRADANAFVSGQLPGGNRRENQFSNIQAAAVQVGACGDIGGAVGLMAG